MTVEAKGFKPQTRKVRLDKDDSIAMALEIEMPKPLVVIKEVLAHLADSPRFAAMLTAEAKLAGALRTLAPYSPAIRTSLAAAVQVLVRREDSARQLQTARRFEPDSFFDHRQVI